MPIAKKQTRQLKYQYRLLWKYQGGRKVHELRSERPAAVLRMLRRVATDTPWFGVGRRILRKAWARLCFRMNIPFAAIAGLPPKDVIVRIQETFPKLDWVRVEHRQVGNWVETIDPLNTLRTPGTDREDVRTEAMFALVSAMTPEELDKWRTVVTDDYLAGRKTMLNNRDNAQPTRHHVEP